MKLPVCVFDLESDMLCSSCQGRLDSGEITRFDVEFSRRLLGKSKEHPELNDLVVFRAIRVSGKLLLVVKKKSKELIESVQELMDELKKEYGSVLIIEGPAKLRTVVRSLIQPAVEVGVNSLYSADGHRESIVMLRKEDQPRIHYSTTELRTIVSAVMGEVVLFEFQDDRKRKEEQTEPDAFDTKMRELAEKR